MRILKTPWKDEFLDLVSQSKDSIKMTSPFAKENICDEIIQAKNPNSKIELYTSFKLMNIYSGSLDLNGLEKIIKQEGVVKNIPKLHSKIYLFDNEKAIITSGNLTNGGLLKNYEYGVFTDDSNIVNQVVEDFEKLSKNTETGTIKLKDIDTVRQILSKLPLQDSIKIPKYDLEIPESNYDIIELPIDILQTSIKGWKLEVLKCAQMITNQEFSLNDINKFIPQLQKKFPNNNHIADKIRQQLQYLRDLGLIEFIGNGKYKKLWK